MPVLILPQVSVSDKILAMKKAVNPRLGRSEPIQRCVLGECRAACCLYGVWIDRAEAQAIRDNAGLIAPYMPEQSRDPAGWFDGREEADEHTPSGRTVHSMVLPSPGHYGGTACVFLREDHKCALQTAAQENGMHPWRFKPFYCILHPLDLDEEGRITLDETSLLLEEPASCLRPAGRLIPLVETFEPELRYLLGEEDYQALVQQIAREEQ